MGDKMRLCTVSPFRQVPERDSIPETSSDIDSEAPQLPTITPVLALFDRRRRQEMGMQNEIWSHFWVHELLITHSRLRENETMESPNWVMKETVFRFRTLFFSFFDEEESE